MEDYTDIILKSKLFSGKTPDDFIWRATGGAYHIEIPGSGHTFEELAEPILIWEKETSGCADFYCYGRSQLEPELYPYKGTIHYSFCVPR